MDLKCDLYSEQNIKNVIDLLICLEEKLLPGIISFSTTKTLS